MAIPWGRFGLFTLISRAVSMMVYALQQGLSLRFANQAAALVCGISGSFLGILSMLFPPALDPVRALGVLRPHVPGGHGLERHHPGDPVPLAVAQLTDVALLFLWAAVFLIVGRTLFVRKEV